MAFIRTKKVKEWKYAYLVENTWKQSKTKQKVMEYLGRVHKLDNIVGEKFDKDIEKLEFKDAISELVKFELQKNGFKQAKGNNRLLANGMISANLEEGRFIHNKKPVVFESNEGFICSFTYKNIMDFKPSGTEEETGLRLAETILEAGISLPHNVFVKLFEKVHKTSMPMLKENDINRYL